MPQLPKIIIILGPTASGKTEWGIKIARLFNGEVASADSRQVYKGMNVGTAKPAGEWPAIDSSTPLRSAQNDRMDSRLHGNDNVEVFVVDGVPHHLMDIVEPDESFTLADFKERAIVMIDDVLKRGKLPIVVGGTGLYIQALVDNLDIPKVIPDAKLRADLEKKTLIEQVVMLKKIDPESAEKIDLKNPRRVLRALEVAMSSGESFLAQQKKGKPIYEALQIGIDVPREKLYGRINARVDEQIKQGLAEETSGLNKKYDWALPSMSGIGYKQMGYYLRGEMSLEEAVEILKRDTRRYAKKQMTWFRRDKRIKWLGDFKEAEKAVKKFIICFYQAEWI